MKKPIKVIDLFAGPGGLGEGFASFYSQDKPAYKIAISIEKESSAYRTLLLRTFFRQFDYDNVPDAYYEFLKGKLGENPEDKLYQIPELSTPLMQAKLEAQQLTLGKDPQNTIFTKIRNAISNDECILIGGPPCQAYSVVGRSRNYGAKEKTYSAKEDNRNFLYLEYLKIISKFQPKLFVMENVKGILSAKIDGKLIFDSILTDLQNPYKSTEVEPDAGREKHLYKIYSLTLGEESLDPHNFIIRAERYGVPQSRHRVILLGIRDDLASNLDSIEKLKLADIVPTVNQIISDLPKLRSRLSKATDSIEQWQKSITDFNKIQINELRTNEHTSEEVLNKLNYYLDEIQKSTLTAGSNIGLVKTNKCLKKSLPVNLIKWYEDERMGDYITNHETRGHITSDLHRYLYYSCYAIVTGKSPTARNLPKILWPKHKNFETLKFSDRFRVQHSNMPATTITSHISKDGHYFIHYDPNQCRSLTVREAARLQTFPDNYHFVGSRTQQYVQVGNAVPPYLAHQIAQIIYKIIN